MKYSSDMLRYTNVKILLKLIRHIGSYFASFSGLELKESILHERDSGELFRGIDHGA